MRARRDPSADGWLTCSRPGHTVCRVERFGKAGLRPDGTQRYEARCDGRIDNDAPERPPPPSKFSPVENFLAEIDDIDPKLRRRLGKQLAAVDEYEQLPASARTPQERRVALDAGQKITDLLERRRLEVAAKSRREELESEILSMMRTPIEHAEADRMRMRR